MKLIVVCVTASTVNMSGQVKPVNSPRALLNALRSKPRNQARVAITTQLAQLLESETHILEPLRVTRTMEGGYRQTDPCRVITLADGGQAVEHINYGDGYETPEDCLDDLTDA